jgi:phosphopantetheinyl transferase
VLDLSATFSCPFGLRAVLMRGSPSLDAVLAHLAPSEQAEAAEVAARRRPEGWQDWSLGRLAAKRAAGAILQERLGHRPTDVALEVRKTAAGAPVLVAGGIHGPPAISIAHVQGTAVAAAAPAGWRVGIDVERPGRIRDPAAFLAQVTTPEEWRALGLRPDADAAALVWSAKEAAAKALGLGLQGQPRLFAVAGGDGRGVDLRVRHAGWTADAQVRRLGDMLCTVAWIPDLGASTLS